MELYTFLMEFRGGTYISQVKETDLRAAMTLWGKNLDLEQIKFLGVKGKSKLQKELEDESPTPIDGVENVWFFCIRIKSGLLMVNMIETV